MPVSIIGINHKTAPVSVREKVAFAPNHINGALLSLKNEALLDEVAIISTCNRMEILFRSKHHLLPSDTDSQPVARQNQEFQVLTWLAKHHQLAIEDIQAHCYIHAGNEAVEHLMSVACGLDSMVLGEPQILGQVKDAYGYAEHAGTLGLFLNRLFQQTFNVAKQVRTDTQIGESAVSVAYAAITLAKRIFADFKSATALFIGAGETIELAARHLVRQGIKNIHVANRTVERAQLLAAEFNHDSVNAQAHRLAALPELIVQADIVISSTASPVPVIGKGLIEKAIAARKHRTMFMVDLAVPRDIEPEVSSLTDVYLYTVDDMQDVIQENIKLRKEAAKEAEDIISLQTHKYFSWLQSLSSVSLLKDYRAQVEAIKTSELERALGRFDAGSEKEQKQLEKAVTELANRLTQKVMHQPSQIIRQAGEMNDPKTLELLSELFFPKK